MKHIYYFRLDINGNTPSAYTAIEVNQVGVAAMNDRLLVVNDADFTKVTLDKKVAMEYFEISKPSDLTWSKRDGDHADKILIEMYCHYQSRADFIKRCNEILAVNEDFDSYYVNALGDVMELAHDHD